MQTRHRPYKSTREEAIIAPLNREPRRGIRFDSRQARTIEWEDADGRSHRMDGITRVVGAFGCKLVLQQGLPLGQNIAIGDPTRNTSVHGIVVWKGKERPEGCEMGVELVTPNMDVWVREPQLAPGEERRRGQRAILQLPVMLRFSMHNHEAISVAAKTLTLNDHGALVMCNRAFPQGTELELENRRTRVTVTCRVRRPPKETPEGFQVALEFAEPVIGFWPVAFPPPQ